MDHIPNEILDLIFASIPAAQRCEDPAAYNDDTHELLLCRLVSKRILHPASKYYFKRRISLCWLPGEDKWKASRLLRLLSSRHATIRPFITSVYIKGTVKLVDDAYAYAQKIVYILTGLPKLKHLTVFTADWSQISAESRLLLGSETMLRNFTWRRTRFLSLNNMIQSIFQSTPQIDRLDIEYVICYDKTTGPSTELGPYPKCMAKSQHLGLSLESDMWGPVLGTLCNMKASFKDIQISCESAEDDDMEAVATLFAQCGDRLESVEVTFEDTQSGISEVIGPHPISFAHNGRLDNLQLRFHHWEALLGRTDTDEVPAVVRCPPDALSVVSTVRSTRFRHLTIRFDLHEVLEADVVPMGFDRLETTLVQTCGVGDVPELVICLALHEECLDLMEREKGRFYALLQDQLPEFHKDGKLTFALERYPKEESEVT